MHTDDLEARIRRIEDRHAIIDTVVAYAVAIDEADWAGFASTMTDPVHIDFSEAGLPAADLPRDQFVGFASGALAGWTARQHLSPNHRVVFDGMDPDKATCYSYMYAQHYKKGAPGGEFYLMRGSYDNELVRTADGWKIAALTQHVSWLEGNPDAAAGSVPE
ncbi:nuclear transport factor 2 family protein [Jidongwangia harbinensis]|uniref:nuclear transport factor 2 family protein n=1 Tax=Jidongwangia harbinensis TaxID=2878561 RepID=UPI001CD9650C|nr:nuclear transport factor 2 family protein [Jidongwangia harbinensis]MCA2216974.1 nuclear transport factor 2 family protein [Jidongwangia harbinensis]